MDEHAPQDATSAALPLRASVTPPPSAEGQARRLTGPFRNREALVYYGVATAMVLFALARAGGPFVHALQDDSYQYLSVAENLRRHGAADTSLIHFDTERSHGRAPAPATTFPPGYSTIIWLVSSTGTSLEWAAVLVSIASTIAVLLLLGRASRVLGLTPFARRVTMFLWAASAQAAYFGSYVMAEALFTASSMAAVVLLLPRSDERGAGARTMLASAVLGLGYWVRYAGLFFIAPFHLYALSRLRSDRSRRWTVGGLLVCDALVAAGLLRNVLLSGTWRGGNTRTTLHSVAATVRDFAYSHLALAFGTLAPRPVFLALAVTMVIGAAWLAVAWAKTSSVRRMPGTHRSAVRLLVLWIAAYWVAMFYAGLTSDVSFGARMFIPVLPLLILLLGIALSVPAASPEASGPSALLSRRASLAVFLIGYAGANGDALLHFDRVAPHSQVAQALALPTSQGRRLSAWIEANIPNDAVIVASSGQATGYLLKRSTVSLVSRHYSDVAWEDDEVRRLMARFGADYLLVYRAGSREASLGPHDPVLAESRFLSRLSAAQFPNWLELVADTPGAIVYRRRVHEPSAPDAPSPPNPISP